MSAGDRKSRRMSFFMLLSSGRSRLTSFTPSKFNSGGGYFIISSVWPRRTELGLPFRGELGKAEFGGRESFFFFAEGEANLRGPVARVVVETGAGDDGDTNFFDEIFGEADVFGFGGETHGVGIR